MSESDSTNIKLEADDGNKTKTQTQSESTNEKNGEEKKSPDEESVVAIPIEDEASQLPKIELNAHFPSFISLRSALDKYQRENHVQLIVKDSKLLSAESTRVVVIPKVYHLVNQTLMYHSITYCCKCHGTLKQKPGSRIKNIGAKRLNCPMYLRFRLSADLQSLVLFDLFQTHNHPNDPNTFQLSPRQQVYRLSRIRRGEPDPNVTRHDEPEPEPVTSQPTGVDVQSLIATAIKDVNSVASLADEADGEPPNKKACTAESSQNNDEPTAASQPRKNEDGERVAVSDVDGVDEDNEEEEDNDDGGDVIYEDNPDSPLDPDSSCSDSDEEDFFKNRHLLSFPVRLIGSAVRSSPELLLLSKQLIESQKENLLVAKKKLILQTQLLELKNAKLSLELKSLEKSLASASGPDQSTTFYLQG